MEAIDAKIIALLGLFVIAIICGLIPLFLAECAPTYRGAGMERLFGFLNCFAGGVILATAMLHLLPEVRREFLFSSDYVKIDPDFPAAEFLACAGIFLMLVIEQGILACKERLTKTATEDIPLTTTEYGYYTDASIHASQDDDEIRTLHEEELEYIQSVLRSYMFFIALCLHGIFEGIVLGLLSDPHSVLILFAAIACHEGPVSFSFAVNIRRSWLRKSAGVVLVCLHAAVFPLGIGIGIAITESASSTLTMSFVSGLMQGVAVGLLVYLTFFEILPYELKENENRMLKTLCVLIGFTVITLLQFIPAVHP
ncbi:zinc transporter ZIP1-like [Saccoglossus kowalevskii]|uniref:Zinc transporter ZIP1-like n=1 Tax=Saccoglossus kowalevskii TaxID=10224 RepID=A0ABM0GLF7_SACKO|nr:PREDICTED: zinc transporter ZIP1-like [Saccoglossus kowalevskii]